MTIYLLVKTIYTLAHQVQSEKNKPEELKHGLIMAAKHLMVSDGVANLSMQKVADTAGTSKGGLFHHFKNKEELLNAVVGLLYRSAKYCNFIHH